MPQRFHDGGAFKVSARPYFGERQAIKTTVPRSAIRGTRVFAADGSKARQQASWRYFTPERRATSAVRGPRVASFRFTPQIARAPHGISLSTDSARSFAADLERRLARHVEVDVDRAVLVLRVDEAGHRREEAHEVRRAAFERRALPARVASVAGARQPVDVEEAVRRTRTRRRARCCTCRAPSRRCTCCRRSPGTAGGSAS